MITCRKRQLRVMTLQSHKERPRQSRNRVTSRAERFAAEGTGAKLRTVGARDETRTKRNGKSCKLFARRHGEGDRVVVGALIQPRVLQALLEQNTGGARQPATQREVEISRKARAYLPDGGASVGGELLRRIWSDLREAKSTAGV